MKRFQFQSKLRVPRPREQVFAFFSGRPQSGARSPHPWLQFRVITAVPIQMQAGTEIDYRIKIRGHSSSLAQPHL